MESLKKEEGKISRMFYSDLEPPEAAIKHTNLIQEMAAGMHLCGFIKLIVVLQIACMR